MASAAERHLASVIANLEIKLGHTTVGPEKLAGLSSACRFIAERANLPLRNDQRSLGAARLPTRAACT